MLFPTEGSLPAQSLLSRAASPFVFEPECYTVILVDGTWTQARKLQRRIPAHIPRVALDAAALQKLSSDNARSAFLSPMRQQDRCSPADSCAARLGAFF